MVQVRLCEDQFIEAELPEGYILEDAVEFERNASARVFQALRDTHDPGIADIPSVGDNCSLERDGDVLTLQWKKKFARDEDGNKVVVETEDGSLNYQLVDDPGSISFKVVPVE